MLVKATEPYPLDAGGRLLAPGETADLDPGHPVVAEHLAAGRLTPVQIVPGPATEPRRRLIPQQNQKEPR